MPLDPLEVHKCDESDFAEFIRIQLAAFGTSHLPSTPNSQPAHIRTASSGMVTLLKPQPMTDEYVQHAIDKHLKSHREERDVTYLKCIDTRLGGKIIACAKWRINKHERTEEQIQAQLPKPGKDEEGKPAAQDFMNYLASVRREYMGTKPFACECVSGGMLGSD